MRASCLRRGFSCLLVWGMGVTEYRGWYLLRLGGGFLFLFVVSLFFSGVFFCGFYIWFAF